MLKLQNPQTDAARVALAMNVASFATGVPVDEIGAVTRGGARSAAARQVAMYLAHVAFEMSLARVAQAFRRDRSTVAHACHLVEDLRDDSAFDVQISQLEDLLRDAPSPGFLALNGRAR
jgi:chromosomal replication initiation ATPase DnaA